MRPNDERSGYIYFALAEDSGGEQSIKIGFTGNVAKRLLGIRSGCPPSVQLMLLGSVRGTTRTEAHIHERFKHLRLLMPGTPTEKGEWYAYDKTILEFLRNISDGAQASGAVIGRKRAECKRCARAFEVRSGNQRYCSVECSRSRIKTGPILNSCEECGVEFSTSRNEGRFCSARCYVEARKKEEMDKESKGIDRMLDDVLRN